MEQSITWYDEIDSTQKPALKAARDGMAEGHIWLADHQTSGRGRRHQGEVRDWVDSPGTSLMFSLLLRPKLSAKSASSLTLAVAVGCARAIEEVCGVQVKLKWPNDLFLGSRKLGGILTEGLLSESSLDAVVVGVGLNVNVPEMPDTLGGNATSLMIETGRSFDRLSLLTSAVQQIRDAVDTLVEHRGLGPLADCWRSRSMMTDRRVSIASGLTGVVRGLTDDGALLVMTDAGELQSIQTGEVVLLDAAAETE